MATFIKGDSIILELWNGVNAYEPIACLTGNSLEQTRNIIEILTKCFTPEILGPELVSDSEFDNPGGWQVGPFWAVAAGQATRTADAGTDDVIHNPPGHAVNIGQLYKITVDVDPGATFAGSGLEFGTNAVGSAFDFFTTKIGLTNFYYKEPGNNPRQAYLQANGLDFEGAVNSLSVKEVIQSLVPASAVIKLGGSISNELTFEGNDIDASLEATVKISHNGLLQRQTAGTILTWRLSTGLNDVPFYYGTGFISALGLDAPAGDEIVSFTGTLAVTGPILDNDPEGP